ncbi:MAG TPA: tetratricopeptide repeat protein [Rhodocyclaceae bacterium]
MSLLMEALKKAEEAKRKATGLTEEELLPSFQVEDAPSNSSVQTSQENHPAIKPLEFSPMAELPQPQESSQFASQQDFSKPHSGRKCVTSPSSTMDAGEPIHRKSTEQQSVQNLFQAKQSLVAEKWVGKNFLIAIGLSTLMSIVSISAYSWRQPLPKIGASSLGSANTNPLPSPAINFSLQTSPTAIAPQHSLPEAIASHREAKIEKSALVTAIPKERLAPPLRPSVPTNDDSIRITTSRRKHNTALESGYEAFQRGDLSLAKSSYENALRNDSNSVDALNGLAATLLRSNSIDSAVPLFQRVLEIDPRNSIAQASLANLQLASNPEQMESQLKIALADQSESPHLYFTLGNLYAHQNRWADAQHAYFMAMSGDPGNPDYLFNLAISLDRLHQAKLAYQYYDQALNAAEHRSASFDRTLASERILKLQP